MHTNLTATFNFEDVFIESIFLNEKENTLEVVKQKKSNVIYATNPPTPVADKVYKEIYGVEKGQIKLIKTIDGKHTPSHYIPAKIEFEE